ncbi:MAG: GNAT family N-acetyltransferase [Gemmatimonadetes bacterium]|nr:GNAT family N-acetyltransferase [Gemmatimonadota bacterium]
MEIETAHDDVVFRDHRPGDMGWVVQRHGELYHDLCGWDATFEALVAEIAARFLRGFDPAFERSWIVEIGGRRAGCCFLTRRDDETAQLRMLLVEPWARGRGLGRRLVAECVAQARRVGYRKMVLYTSKGLDSARRLYEAEGFRLVEETPRHQWGQDHVEQWWELGL